MLHKKMDALIVRQVGGLMTPEEVQATLNFIGFDEDVTEWERGALFEAKSEEGAIDDDIDKLLQNLSGLKKTQLAISKLNKDDKEQLRILNEMEIKFLDDVKELMIKSDAVKDYFRKQAINNKNVVLILHGNLKNAESVNFLEWLPKETSFDVMYIGGGHGQCDEENGQGKVLSDMGAKPVKGFIDKLHTNESRADAIVLGSCYSASFAEQFRGVLSNKGIMLSDTTSCGENNHYINTLERILHKAAGIDIVAQKSLVEQDERRKILTEILGLQPEAIEPKDLWAFCEKLSSLNLAELSSDDLLNLSEQPILQKALNSKFCLDISEVQSTMQKAEVDIDEEWHTKNLKTLLSDEKFDGPRDKLVRQFPALLDQSQAEINADWFKTELEALLPEKKFIAAKNKLVTKFQKLLEEEKKKGIQINKDWFKTQLASLLSGDESDGTRDKLAKKLDFMLYTDTSKTDRTKLVNGQDDMLGLRDEFFADLRIVSSKLEFLQEILEKLKHANEHMHQSGWCISDRQGHRALLLTTTTGLPDHAAAIDYQTNNAILRMLKQSPTNPNCEFYTTLNQRNRIIQAKEFNDLVDTTMSHSSSVDTATASSSSSIYSVPAPTTTSLASAGYSWSADSMRRKSQLFKLPVEPSSGSASATSQQNQTSSPNKLTSGKRQS
jgi:hypothetical protein